MCSYKLGTGSNDDSVRVDGVGACAAADGAGPGREPAHDADRSLVSGVAAGAYQLDEEEDHRAGQQELLVPVELERMDECIASSHEVETNQNEMVNRTLNPYFHVHFIAVYYSL